MFIPFGAGAYANNSFGLPPVVLENWMAEEAPDRPDKGFRLVPTPGQSFFADPPTVAEGRGTFQSDGVLGGDLIFVGGTRINRVNEAGTATWITGTTANDGFPAQFAASQAPQLVAVSGGSAYLVGSSSVTPFTWAGPTGGIVGAAVINQRHIYPEANSGRVWISAPGNATSVTKFVTAEQNPDFIRKVLSFAGVVIFFGAKSLEVWSGTQSTDEPLVPNLGLTRERGIIGRDAACVSDFSAFFVGDDGIVYRNPFQPTRISTHPIEKTLSALTAADKLKVRLSSYEDEGHAFVHLYIPNGGDWFYDSATREWHRRKKLSEVGYGYSHYVRAFGKVYAQDLTTGALVRLSADYATDREATIRRVASAIVPVSEKTRFTNLIVEAQEGIALDGSGYGSQPMCELTVYRDGRTPDSPIQKPMGKRGAYGWRTEFGPLGQLDEPVVKLEVAMSDPVAYSVYGMSANTGRR